MRDIAVLQERTIEEKSLCRTILKAAVLSVILTRFAGTNSPQRVAPHHDDRVPLVKTPDGKIDVGIVGDAASASERGIAPPGL